MTIAAESFSDIPGDGARSVSQLIAESAIPRGGSASRSLVDLETKFVSELPDHKFLNAPSHECFEGSTGCARSRICGSGRSALAGRAEHHRTPEPQNPERSGPREDRNEHRVGEDVT